MWLLWGREVASGTLSTVDGPAFKPLPVGVCALLAALGPAAPAAWVLLARAAALAALWLAFRLGVQLGGGSRAAGALAALAVALCGGYPAYAAGGLSEGVLRTVAFEPRPPGTVFRSRLTAGAAPSPEVPPPFAAVARTGEWEVFDACGVRVP